MTERLVTTTRTTPSMRDFALALIRVWPETTKEQAGVLWAHFAGETGDGKSCWNFNLGNVKRVKGDGYDYVSLRGVWEGFVLKDLDGDGDIDADDRTMLVARLVATGLWIEDTSKDHAIAVGPTKVSMVAASAHSATWFRAYPDLAAGMTAFIEMKRRPGRRYSGAWAFVLAGDYDGYARELGRKGYYTASPDAYARAMTAKHAAWMRSAAFDDALSDVVVAASEAETQPEVEPYQEEPQPVVRNLRESLDADRERARLERDSEPDPEAA